MADLTTQYMGLTLQNPFIVGSSGLTDTVDKIVELEKSGAGAVVLKSIFEEEILHEYNHILASDDQYESNSEYLDYYDFKIKQDNINKYINLIKDVKAKVTIPVIASVNCVSAHEWTYFTKKIEAAGADAIELNVFVLPSDLTKTGADNEKVYFDVIRKAKAEVKIPVALKISHYFSNLGRMVLDLSKEADALVLFNRFYSPDFDILEQKVVATHVLSQPEELALPLRWVSMLSDKAACDIAGSTGVHSCEAAIKMLLAGAKTVQVASALYRNGNNHLTEMVSGLQEWMNNNKYLNLDQFRGSMCQAKSQNPAMYERVQFMKYFSDKK